MRGSSGVDVFDASLAIQDKDHVLAGLGQRPVAFLAPLERRGSFFNSSLEFRVQLCARQRQRDLASATSAIAIGLPLYLYHWNTIQKENKKKKIEG